MDKRFIATYRYVFLAEDEVEAHVMANQVQELLDVEDGDSFDVTQIIPADIRGRIEPAELCEQLRKCRDMLILTRIIQCLEQAKELDKIAWILEHRSEESFDLAGYDYGAVYDRAEELLKKKEKGE